MLGMSRPQRKWRNSILAASILFCTFLASDTSSSGQTTELNTILEKLRKRYDKSDCISCSFRTKKRIVQLAGEVLYTGKLYYKKPHFIHMELAGEENLRIISDGVNIWLEDLDFKEVEVHDFEDLGGNQRLSQLVPSIFFQSMNQLQQDYEIQFLGKERGMNLLAMKPKREGRFSLDSLQVDIGRFSKITRLKVEYTNGDFTETEFWDWKEHPEISDHFFKYRQTQREKKP